MNTPIPASLQAALTQHFSGQSFTLFAVLTHAKSVEIDDWKIALKTLLETGVLECVDRRMLGDVFTLSVHGGAA